MNTPINPDDANPADSLETPWGKPWSSELLLQTQHEFSGILVGGLDRETLLEAILDSALRLPELDGGGLYWREPDGGYRLVVQRGLPPAFFARAGHLATGSPQADIIRQGRLRCSCTIPQDHCTDPSLALEPVLVEEGVRSLMVLPIQVGGEPLACLNLASMHVGAVDRLAVATLETLARQFTQALEHLFAQEKAARQRQNLAGLFEAIADYLFVLDMEGRILHYNPAVAEGLGYGNSLFGQPIWVVHPPEAHDEARRVLAEMLAGTRTSCPLPLLKADGERLFVDTRVVVGHWNGQPALIGVSRGITEQVRQQEALRDEKQFSEDLINSLPVTTYYLPAHAVVAAGGENNSRNRAKTPSPCLRKVEMTA